MKFNDYTKSDDKMQAVHMFERAGLGKAPFKVVGFGKEIYQAVPGDSRCPIQPGACCDYCGTAIMYVAYIESACGKRSKVGSECVNKTGDFGLKNGIKNSPEFRKMNRDKAKAKDEAVKEEIKQILSNETNRQKLGAELGRIEYALSLSGAAGRARWLKYTKKLLS